jgi:hypothetical protein
MISIRPAVENDIEALCSLDNLDDGDPEIVYLKRLG